MLGKYLLAPLTLALFVSNSYASDIKPELLADAVTHNATLKAEFQRITETVLEQAPWIRDYGTATPAEPITIDATTYLVYRACKPHDCPSQGYAVLFDTTKQTMVAGAFIENSYRDQLNLATSTVHWLGNTQLEHARALADYLF